MANAGHPFTSSAALSAVNRLVSTADTTALLYLLKSTTVTIGASPSATTANGFSATVTQNATGDYTMNFATAFTTAPFILAIPIETGGHRFCTIYSVSTSAVRVRVYDAGGSLADPDSLMVLAIGV